ncbi:hypothetical protein DPMN_185828 [Dreissena polymorpha]|uniref:Uncharacterized protein n=1 Tax=Dreissena polymorpha TaxID=45954 RepID=A0A9D4DMM4_DREPO|nr:hypothetical protein DPMN_185828 [Dreissena polymorpha]
MFDTRSGFEIQTCSRYAMEGNLGLVSGLEKGYRLRDTDDRLHRMKSQAQVHRSSCVGVNKTMNGNVSAYDGNLKKQAHLLSKAKLKRRGITRYDAKIILAHGHSLPEPKVDLGEQIPTCVDKNAPTNRQTNRQTGQKQYVPHYYSGGHKKGETSAAPAAQQFHSQPRLGSFHKRSYENSNSRDNYAILIFLDDDFHDKDMNTFGM